MSSAAEIWTIRKVLAWSSHFLKEKGSPSARLDAEVLLAESMKCSRVELYTNIEKPLQTAERDQYRDKVRRRSMGEPVAYILGRKGFWKHDFVVNPKVLIPRPDTECLLEAAGEYLIQSGIPAPQILDVGTGSGCIAVSLALDFPESNVVAWDIDEGALAVARENGDRLNAGNVCFERCDALHWEGEQRLFDLIVSNPPYIGEVERETLDRSVVGFEPGLALFADDGGLAFYQSYAAHMHALLKEGARIFVEVGQGQVDKVVDLFRMNGWQDVEVFADLSEVPRVVSARRVSQ